MKNLTLTTVLLLYGCVLGCTEPTDRTKTSPDEAENTSTKQASNSSISHVVELYPDETIRIATFNASLYRKNAGELVRDLSDSNNKQAKQIAEIIQRMRPDVLLINEIDYQPDHAPPTLLRENYFSIGQNGEQPIDFPYVYAPPSNTGLPSGFDLNSDGNSNGPEDCFGFGRYPGQYAFAVFSRFPIGVETRSFQTFLWSDMPGSFNPQAPGADTAYYSTDAWQILRLSSKNHCDVMIEIPCGHKLHFLVSHPTPPVFDAEEDRNGLRNAAEIRFWVDYISGPTASEYIYDDNGVEGGLPGDAHFVIAGDLNSDAVDGDSRHESIQTLLRHERIRDPAPKSNVGRAANHADKRNRTPQTPQDPFETAGTDTAQWSSGNLRVDYVLPSSNLNVKSSGVFWPMTDDPNHELLKSTDHRLVWVDVEW